jgi:glutamyl-tRNA reductase
MNLLCTGISHHTAPIEVREKLWFSDDEALSSLLALKERGFGESVLFSTCNRTELYTVGTAIQIGFLKDFLIEQKSARHAIPSSSLFSLEGQSAIRHLFEVAAGIDSMIMGDVQILSQVKNGYHRSQQHGTLGFLLNKVFQSAFHTGKRVRNETTISEGAISISYAAVELAEKIFDRLDKKTALVIGAGETSELTAKHLRSKEIGTLLITNRTTERAEILAKKIGGVVLPFDSFHDRLKEVDIIISSVDSKEHILTADEIDRVNKERNSTALFIIDIGVPRNVDPSAKKLDNVFLYDIDNLQIMVDENIRKRGAAVPEAKRIVDEEVHNFSQWYSSLEANPTISALRDLAEQVRKEEVEKNVNRFQQSDRELLEIVTKRIVNKLLHAPLVNLKNGHEDSANERVHKIALVRKLFGLDEHKDRVDGS